MRKLFSIRELPQLPVAGYFGRFTWMGELKNQVQHLSCKALQYQELILGGFKFKPPPLKFQVLPDPALRPARF